MILRPRFASPTRYSILFGRRNNGSVPLSTMVLRPREAYRRSSSPVKKRRTRSPKHVSAADAKKIVVPSTPRDEIPCPTAKHTPQTASPETTRENNENVLVTTAPLIMDTTPLQEQNDNILFTTATLMDTPLVATPGIATTNTLPKEDHDIAYVSDEEVLAFPTSLGGAFVGGEEEFPAMLSMTKV